MLRLKLNQSHSQLFVVEREVEGPGKGWLSHDQIFQYCWKIFLQNYWVVNFCNKFSKYIGTFGHVTNSLYRDPCLPHVYHKEALGMRLHSNWIGTMDVSLIDIYTVYPDCEVTKIDPIINKTADD